MRVLHFADLHIGVENYGRIDPETGLSSRLLDFLSALDELVDYALDNSVDLVLLAGDAYKNRDPSQTQQRELAKRLSRLSEAGVSVFLLVGNHDIPNSIGRATAIDIFDTLQVPSVYVGDQLKIYSVDTRSGPIQIVALPWPKRSKLLAKQDTRRMSLGDINGKIQDLLTEGIKSASDNLDPQIPAILAGHVTISGASLGSERSMMLGKDHILLPSALHLPCFEYIALGHIHKHQVIKEDPLMVYSGSLQRVDFSEESDVKGFCVVDLDTAKVQGSRMVSYNFVPVEARKFITIDVGVPEGNEDPTSEVLKAISRFDIVDAVVRVRINLTSEQRKYLDDRLVREGLGKAYFIAAITIDMNEEHRTRIPSDSIEGLDLLSTMELYLRSKNVQSHREKQLLKYAEELLEEELNNDQD